MNNLERLKLEIRGIDFEDFEVMVYLEENELDPHSEYTAKSATNKKGIYSAALSILESIANNPSLMKTIKVDDMTVSDFHENLMSRIDQLESKIRKMKTDEQVNNETNFFMLFNG